MAKLGTTVAAAKQTAGVPPVILQAQANGYVKLSTPAEIAQWESDVKSHYGLSINVAGTGMHACETCSGGCSDDCGLI